jgi:hypothetical protein
MSNYTLTINTSAPARQALTRKGYNLVFAKGVSSGGEVDYNAAWIVLKPSEMSASMKISWDVDYYANYTTSQLKNRAEIQGTGTDLKMDPGGAYVVDVNGELIVDQNVSPNPNPDKSSFAFHNDQGYSLEYVPILESLDDKNKRVPIWAASTGVSKNGLIAATPVEIVRVWAGKYEQGQAVLAEYATVGVEFDLTTTRFGQATFNDDLSDWTSLSSNAKVFEPDANLRLIPTQLSDALKNLSDEIYVTVLVTFTTALTIAAVTYLTSKLIDKFAPNLKPSSITVSKPGGLSLTVKFRKTAAVLATLGLDTYETAVDNALSKAKSDSKSGLAEESWKISDTQLTNHY